MKVYITKKAQKELDKLPDPIARIIVRSLQQLEETPYPANSKKLQGRDNYRLRVGSFRAIYTVNKKEKEITILRVADRKTIYR